MLKLNKKEKIIASVFAVFLILFLLYKGILIPFLNRLKTIDTKLNGNEKKLAEFIYIDLQRKNILETYDKVKSYIEIGKTEEDALAVIMKEIEEMAKNCDVSLLNMKPETAAEKTELAYKTKKANLSIEGFQKNIIKLLYKLENSHYPLSIEELDFKVKDRDAGLMEADLDVHFIYFL